MEDFIFGATDFTQQRVTTVRKRLGGVIHAYRAEPLAPRPIDVVSIWLWVGDDQTADAAYCYYTIDGSDPQGQRGRAENGTAVAMWAGTVEWHDLRWSFGRWWHCELPSQAEGTIVRYRLEAFSTFGGPSYWADNGARFAYLVSSLTPPAWAKDAIIYHVLMDRFYAGDGRSWLAPSRPDGFYGGTLQGVIDKLDYIADLGATAIWLSPVFASPSHHGYDCTDYYHVEPRLGDNQTLKRLVHEAHKRGMRVLLDFVANHCSRLHPFFRTAQKDRNSEYFKWFTFRKWPNDYLSFFGVKSLPQWNLDYAPARLYMIDVACYWIKEYGIDGYRLDYTLGQSNDFWTDFHRAVRQTSPEAFCLAEAVESPEVMRAYTGRVEGCLDFPLLEVMRQVFGYNSKNVAQLDAFLAQRAAFFPNDLVLGSFLDNHDMNRFLWVTGGDKQRLKLAALCQFTLPSPPIVYYGTEVGIQQSGDVRGPRGNAYHYHARTPMPWGEAQDRDLLNYFRRLSTLRRAHPSLRLGNHTRLHLDGSSGAYAYACHLLGDCVIVAMNTGQEPVTLSLPVRNLGLANGAVLADALSDAKVQVGDGMMEVQVQALNGVALA